MSLRDSLGKAARLLFVLPPEEPKPAPDSATVGETDGELDSLLAELGRKQEAPTAPTRTVEEIVREAAGPNLDQIRVDSSTTAALITDGVVDFGAIYTAAALPPAPFTAEQLLEMLTALPHELPLETRRSTVRVSLNALGKSMGATPDTIVADASRKLTALASYLDDLSKRTAAEVAAAEAEIVELQARIEARRQSIQSAQQTLFQTTQRCTAESDRLDDVLEFFSLDVAPSKYAPP